MALAAVKTSEMGETDMPPNISSQGGCGITSSKTIKLLFLGNLYLVECKWLYEVCTEEKSPANFK